MILGFGKQENQENQENREKWGNREKSGNRGNRRNHENRENRKNREYCEYCENRKGSPDKIRRFLLMAGCLCLLSVAAAGCAQSASGTAQTDLSEDEDLTNSIWTAAETEITEDEDTEETVKSTVLGVSVPFSASGWEYESASCAGAYLSELTDEETGFVLYTAQSTQDQAAQLEEMLEEGVHAVVVDPAESVEDLADSLTLLSEAGIFTVLFGETSDTAEADAYVTMEESVLGAYAAQSVTDAGCAGMQVLVFSDTSLTEATQRAAGFESGLSSEVTITLVSSLATSADQAKQSLLDWIGQKETLELEAVGAIFAADEEILQGILEGLAAYESIYGTVFTNLRIIVGCGSSEELLSVIEEDTAHEIEIWYYDASAIETAIDLAVAGAAGSQVETVTAVEPVSVQSAAGAVDSGT